MSRRRRRGRHVGVDNSSANRVVEDLAQHGVQDQLDEFRGATSSSLGMRVGINTGPVVLGAVGTTGELTALGDTVNLASRLEHAAPTGGILLSHATYRHVRGVFDVTVREPIAVKGKTDLVQIYEVLRGSW